MNEERKNIILEKSYYFAREIVLLYSQLKSEKEYDLSRQLLRSGTSVGANIEEAQGAQSKRDFIAKMQISLKEARETHYWLRLLRDTEIVESSKANMLLSLCTEIITILTSILKKAKNGANN